MYGVKHLQFDPSYPDPACDACNNKHLSLFSLGEYCKVYDNKTCCFSELAKEQIHLCKECVFALRKTKVFQTSCFNAQKLMQAYVNRMHTEYEHLQNQRNSYQRVSNRLSASAARRGSTPQTMGLNTNVPLACGCLRRP